MRHAARPPNVEPAGAQFCARFATWTSESTHNSTGWAWLQLVADGEVQAAELLQLAQARADRFNPKINAICARLDQRAEQRLSGDLQGPFAGVPFLLKDLHQDLAGTTTTDGCRALAHRTVFDTSTVVQRWLDAGVVIFGKTNTPEFGAKGITEPDLFGPTRNPWDLDRTPGGSSGGAAAAVAAGIVPVAGASDGGGSIRIPAACTGLVGLKAGRGLIPSGPHASDPLNGQATDGVISRSVRDTAAMLDVLAGPDEVSAFAPATPDAPFLDDLDRPPERLRIGYTTASAIRGSAHPEATRAVEVAAAAADRARPRRRGGRADVERPPTRARLPGRLVREPGDRGGADQTRDGRQRRRLRAGHPHDGRSGASGQRHGTAGGARTTPRSHRRIGAASCQSRPSDDAHARRAADPHRITGAARGGCATWQTGSCAPAPSASCS